MGKPAIIYEDQFRSDRRQKLFYYLGFLIWPFGSMFASFSQRGKAWPKNILWLFCIYFGSTFVLSSEGLDSARYAEMLNKFYLTKIKFSELVASLYSVRTNYVDIVQPVLTYIVSIFTNNLNVLFAVYGLVFGFFYSRNLWYLIDKTKGDISLVLFIFLFSFALLCPFWYINAFRMYSAMQVFIYGLLPFLIDGKKNNLWWSASAVLFHFSFVLPVSILLLYLLIKNRPRVYFVFFIVTVFISEIDLEIVRNLFSYFPAFLQSRIGYTDASYANEVRELSQNVNWYVPMSQNVLRWIVYAFIITIYIKSSEGSRLGKNIYSLFCFGLLMYGCSNIAGLVPSGNRYEIISNIIMMAFIILYISGIEKDPLINLLRLVSIPALLLFIAVAIRIWFDTCGFFTLFGNPVTALIHKDIVPVIDFVKHLL